MNLQEIFNKAVSGVYTQGRPARGGENGSCMYIVERENGTYLYCAVGHVLSDEALALVNNQLNAGSLEDLNQKGLLQLSFGRKRTQQDHDMLYALQEAHDDASRYGVDDFRADFLLKANVIADEFELDHFKP